MHEHTNLSVRRVEPEAHLLLHCDQGDAPELAQAARIVLPNAMLRAERLGAWHALHLAPDEWLLIGPPGEVDALVEGLQESMFARSLVDISDRALTFEITGPDATTLLAAGCPLDLGDASFPVGSCTRTLFGKVMVMLWRTPHAYRLEYARSFDGYISALLEAAANDVTAPIR